MTCLIRSSLWNLLLKFEAICWMQYIDFKHDAFHPTSCDRNADNKSDPLFDVMHKFCWGVTYVRKRWQNHIQASFVSSSTIANNSRNMFQFSSCAMTFNKVTWHFPVENVSSTCITGLQHLKPSVHSLKNQNTRSRMKLDRSSTPPKMLELALYRTIIHGTHSWTHCIHLARSLYESS